MNGRPTAAAAGKIDVGGDLTANRLGFGAMRITGPGIWGDPPDRERAIQALRRAVALDVNFIDTADSYGPEVSERLIAEALYPYPEDLVIATKGGLVRPGPGQWVPDGRPEHLRRACEGSLARLRLDRIDLYQFHRPDPKVPIAESIGALAELKDEGKIRHIGVSNVTENRFREAERVAAVVSVQNRYNVADRSSEPMLDLCDLEMVVFIPWAPVEETGTIPALMAAGLGDVPGRDARGGNDHRSAAQGGQHGNPRRGPDPEPGGRAGQAALPPGREHGRPAARRRIRRPRRRRPRVRAAAYRRPGRGADRRRRSSRR
jgi:pyridoxine 4-dehydrogenase